MQQGYIKLKRSFVDWRWYKNIPVRILFEHLLLIANFADAKIEDITVKRGQVKTGRKQLAQETGLSEQNVRSSLRKLIATGEIRTGSKRSYTLITICNYDSYICSQPTSNQQVTNNQPTSNQQVTNNQPLYNKNNKNKKNKEENIRKESTERKDFVFGQLRQMEFQRNYLISHAILPGTNLFVAIMDWLQYKREKGSLYNSELTLGKLLDRINMLSGYNPSKAVEIINRSIANNYDGLWGDKQKTNNGDNYTAFDDPKAVEHSGVTSENFFTNYDIDNDPHWQQGIKA